MRVNFGHLLIIIVGGALLPTSTFLPTHWSNFWSGFLVGVAWATFCLCCGLRPMED